MTGKEGSVWIRDAATGNAIYRLNKELIGADCLAYSRDGRLIAAGLTNELYLWEASTGKLTLHIHNSIHFLCRCSALSPDGRALATAGLRESVLVWDLTGWG
jgi:WD40 repeat protein